jgi:hypothetical protein
VHVVAPACHVGVLACDWVRIASLGEAPACGCFCKTVEALTLTEEFAVDLGYFALGKTDCSFFVTSNPYTPVKNTLG